MGKFGEDRVHIIRKVVVQNWAGVEHCNLIYQPWKTHALYFVLEVFCRLVCQRSSEYLAFTRWVNALLLNQQEAFSKPTWVGLGA